MVRSGRAVRPEWSQRHKFRRGQNQSGLSLVLRIANLFPGGFGRDAGDFASCSAIPKIDSSHGCVTRSVRPTWQLPQ